MFTAKIMNYSCPQALQDGQCKDDIQFPELDSVYLREWGSIEVWLPSSQNYKNKVEDLKQETYNDYHNDIEGSELTPSELESLIELQGTYKAFVTYENKDGEDSFYCIAENEEVYITDSNGKTVYAIK